MKTGFSLALTFFASALLLAGAESYRMVSVAPPAPAREFRGAWIATVANMDWPSAPGLSAAQQKAELVALLDTAVRLRLNTVVFQVRPACDAFYASSLEPWSQYLTGYSGQAPQPYYDPLAFAIEEAHKRGLELHAWFNPFRARATAGTLESANHVSHLHPEWVHEYNGQLWLDPGDPAVRDYVLRVIMDVVRRYDVDGVQFDDYFYPYPQADRNFPDDTTWRMYGMRGGYSRDDWRRQNISQFIQNVYQNIKAAKPWVKFGVSPFGIWRPGNPQMIRGLDSYAKLYADSRSWLANGWVDYLSPQLYWAIDPPEHSYPALLSWWAAQNVKHRNLWPGLAAYQLPPLEIARQILVTRAQPGASGELFFHLRNFLESPALADSVAREYTQSALVPASPWLPSSPLPKPEMVARAGGFGWTFQWAIPGGTPARWLLQVGGPDNNWTTKVLPGYQTIETFSFSPQVVSVRAMDRNGNLGPAIVVGKANTGGGGISPMAPITPSSSNSPSSGSGNSFWGTYKWKR